MANFNAVPTVHAPRSRFDLSFSHKTSGNVGTLYPIYLQEIYPGDVFDCKASIVTRLSSAYLRPVMDDLYLDVYFFFVPGRLAYNKFQEIFGENNDSAWVQQNPVSAPTLPDDVAASYYNYVAVGSVADHFGLPLCSGPSDSTYLPSGINILPFRSLAIIYNDWFRDENIIAPMHIQKGASQTSEYLNGNAWSASNYTGMCPKVAKFHDYFTSCLPGPQKGDPVSIPVSGLAPLTTGVDYKVGGNTDAIKLYPGTWNTSNNSASLSASHVIADGSYGKVFTPADYPSAAPGLGLVDTTNLYADLAASGVMATVSDLRFAFQLQKILERASRSGSRYTEYLLSAFGISSPDARLQRSEYLGGKRMPLSVQQVAQTSRTDSEPNALASLGAFSLSNGKCGYTKGFVEHGYVIGVMCIRQRHTYQQGIEKFWSRSQRFSYYDPAFCTLSEQPVGKDELFGIHSQINDPINGSPFGYQEAWADLRYRPNMVSGQMRSDASNTLDIWHFADDYSNAPTLNKQWLEETPDYVARTLAVTDYTELDQFIFDIYFKNIGTRRLPTFSVPSLIDHH